MEKYYNDLLNDNEATPAELKAAIIALRERNDDLRADVADARLMARGWRGNCDLLRHKFDAVKDKLKQTLQRVGEFLRYFGPLPHEFYENREWQVETDYFPEFDLNAQYDRGQAVGDDDAFWRGVFRERERFLPLDHERILPIIPMERQ